ncbi:MAG TPA: threonine--tRNA ligase, partial [Deltaproteobacteria bacterium]|nr:threonine--tRNA ligase [Deltaproteobacteria bacterium]
MPDITVTLDGKPVSLDGSTLRDLITDARVVAARVDGTLVDLSSPVAGGQSVVTVKADSADGVQILRHSASHVMAEAVKILFPDARPTIGPATDDGFYYDFDRGEPFSSEDLAKIEDKMNELVGQDAPFIRKEMGRTEAKAFFEQRGEPYKVEIIGDLPDDVETVSLYEQGSFVDLCRGPHVPTTGYLKAFKLLSVAGAYWRGDERNKMLQRIYGTAWRTPAELDDYLKKLEEAQKRDHRKLGRELDLFSIHEEVGPGLVLWHPRGAIMRKVIEDYWRDQHLKNGYQLIFTPHVGRATLWQTSGHLDFYKENMYPAMELEEETYYVKPMNCPFHIRIYTSKTRSYREMPMRMAELGTVYRFERSGVLHGLLRVRGFTQDDAHIYCRPEQI